MFFQEADAAVRFIPNAGQWEGNILYKADISGGSMYVERDGISYFFYDMGALHDATHNGKAINEVQGHVVKIKFEGSPGISKIENSIQSETYYNYFIGNDPAKWASGLHNYKTLVLKNVWDGIDIRLDGQEDGIKYDFIVAPKADPKLIRLRYLGASDIQLKDGELHVGTTLSDIIEDEPYAYQSGIKKEIPARFVIENGNVISFDISNYSRSRELVIDPTVVFATFSGSYADNWGFTGTYDQEGNAYSGGTVYGTGFPSTSGSFQMNFQGGSTQNNKDLARDAGILKYSPDGKQLLWATYLGGNHNEQPHSMVVNSKGELLVMGTTLSFNFPMASGYDVGHNGEYDIFVVKLSSDGKQLLSSSFLGGSGSDGINDDPFSANYFGYKYTEGALAFNYGDAYRGEVIVDSKDNVYIASCTRSRNFPVINGFQNSFNGGSQDGCIAKFSPELDQLLWGSYLGGSGQDAAYGINFDADSNVVVAGGTLSNDFPVSNGAYQTSRKGDVDGFITKVKADTATILASTYIGTAAYDQAYFIQGDDRNKIYVTGQTLGNFPVSPGVYANHNSGQFIAILENDLRSIYRSTVFGSGEKRINISPSAFLVDLCGRIYVSGWGGEINAEVYHGGNNKDVAYTRNLPITGDAYQETTRDSSDFYLIILSHDLGSLVYGSYFGGERSHEHVDGGTSRFDRDGKVYQSVCGGCGGRSDFPTTPPDVWSTKNNGKTGDGSGGCNNAIFKIDLNSSIYAPEFKDTVLEVIATEELYYSFTIIDKDVYDSIYVSYESDIFDPKKIDPPVAEFKAPNGMQQINGYLYWQTTCNHISTDTYTVNLTIRDNGCPTPRVTYGKIKIVVKGPEIPDPPAIFCLRRIHPDSLQLNWDEFSVGGHVKEYRLVRRSPDGSEEVIKSINNKADQSHKDYAPGHQTIDYCYFMYGVGVCDDIGDSTREICSVPTGDTIPRAIKMFTVTVERDSFLKVVWNKYQKDDFYEYHVYRKENIPFDKSNSHSTYSLYRTIKEQNDTLFIDSSVRVHEKSYCYKVIMRSQCGLFSPDSSYGCSILLTGNAVPFINKLSWNDYKLWEPGVERHEITRWDPSRKDSIVGFTDGNSTLFNDEKLDYNMGLYYYKVTAFEKADGKPTGAVSVSNSIKLIQKPILHVPNVFTPNEDGLNDVWNVLPTFVKDYHMKVFNRWGEFVWDTKTKHGRWDGLNTYRGNTPFDNTYIWQVEYTGWDGSENYRHGYLNIIW